MNLLVTIVVFVFILVSPLGSMRGLRCQERLIAETSSAAFSQAQASPQTEPQPEPTATVPRPPDQPPQTPDQSPQTQAATPPPTKHNPGVAPHVKKRQARTKNPVGTQSGKVVVRNGGARDSSDQISPGISAEQELHHRETTAQLLATTDANLKKIAGRQMTPAQQSMLQQINSYLTQAKTAAQAGDVARAHTLAFKAHLLSDELARK